MSNTRTFPIQGGLRIPWEAAETAYETYARYFGRSQSLEELAERGGFGLLEWGTLYMGRNPAGMPHSRAEDLTTAALAKVFDQPSPRR